MAEAESGEDRLVDLIYASLLGEASWQQFVDELTTTGSEKAVLLTHARERHTGCLAVTSGLSSNMIAAYEERYASLNVLQAALSRQPNGVSLSDEALHPRKELVRTEFYNDFLIPHEVTSSVSLKIFGDQRRSFSLVTANAQSNPRRDGKMAALQKRLAPHLKRAFDFHREHSLSAHASLLEAIDVSVVALGEGARVKTISPAAQRIARRRAPFRISPMQQLRLLDEAAQAMLERMLHWPYTGPKTFSTIAGGMKLTLVSVTKDHLAWYFEGPTVLLLLDEPKRAAFDPQPIAATYRLTKAEVRALKGIVAGRSAAQIATVAGLSHETIKAQIKSLYAKTGAHGREDILRLAHSQTSFDPEKL